MVFTQRQKGEPKEITKEMPEEILPELTVDSRFLDILAYKLINKFLDQVSEVDGQLPGLSTLVIKFIIIITFVKYGVYFPSYFIAHKLVSFLYSIFLF